MKCPVCGEEVAGDPIAHIKTQSHEAALAKLIESEQAFRPTPRAADAAKRTDKKSSVSGKRSVRTPHR